MKTLSRIALLATLAVILPFSAHSGTAYAQQTQTTGGTSMPSMPSITGAQSSQTTGQSSSPAAGTTGSALMPQQTSGIFLPGGFAFPQTNPFAAPDSTKEDQAQKKYRYNKKSADAATMPPKLFNNIPKRRLND